MPSVRSALTILALVGIVGAALPGAAAPIVCRDCVRPQSPSASAGATAAALLERWFPRRDDPPMKPGDTTRGTR